MISVIICCRNQDFLCRIRRDIEKSIGGEFELVLVNNELREYTISQAYNYGLSEAKYEALVFCHDDITFHTKNWGSRLLSHLSHPSVGVVGVAGGTFFPNAPATWWSPSKHNEKVLHHLQRRPSSDSDTDKSYLVTEDFINSSQPLNEVIALDGFFMATTKAALGDFCWDTEIGDWHGYDIDVCLSLIEKRRVNFVCTDILIEHWSLGSPDGGWACSVIEVWKKHAHQLPVSLETSEMVAGIGLEELKTFVYWTHQHRFVGRELRIAINQVVGRSIFRRTLRIAVCLSYCENNLTRRFGFALLNRIV
jgi:hypothetical protein